MEVGFRGTRLLSSSLTVAEGSSKELVEVLGQRSSIWSFRYPAERSYGTEVSRRAMLFVLSAFGIGSGATQKVCVMRFMASGWLTVYRFSGLGHV